MATLKIYGRVAELFDPRTGTSANGDWSLQDILIEEANEKRLSVILATIDNFKLPEAEGELITQSVEQNRMLTFSCDISSRKWEKNGRAGYATNIHCWRIEDGDTRNASPATTQRNASPIVVRVGNTKPAATSITTDPFDTPKSDELPF